MTGHSLRAAISAACDLTNPRLSEVDWDEVAAAFDPLRSTGNRDETGLDRERLANAFVLMGSPMPPGRLDDLIAFYEDTDDD